MTTNGKLTARPPISPHANLTATTRAGITTWGSATWTVECTCGASMTSCATRIKNGKARCEKCNLSNALQQAAKITPLLPATYLKLDRKTDLSYGKVRYRIEWMRDNDMCHIGSWERPEMQGPFLPVFHAGPGEDVPCNLEKHPHSVYEKRYKKRVARAIAKAEKGGPEDWRYAKHITLNIADKAVRETRAKPNTWFSALGGSNA